MCQNAVMHEWKFLFFCTYMHMRHFQSPVNTACPKKIGPPKGRTPQPVIVGQQCRSSFWRFIGQHVSAVSTGDWRCRPTSAKSIESWVKWSVFGHGVNCWLQVVETSDTASVDVSFLHTSHCLGSGQIMISALGSKDGKPKGVMFNNHCKLRMSVYAITLWICTTCIAYWLSCLTIILGSKNEEFVGFCFLQAICAVPMVPRPE